ncbi:MAG TPA: site-specific integrase, partial [Candidatus Sulfotelmatobacter sp.]|nr:site-specific integrase [Candidatus Sulfotelmatobacter sp.]
VNGLKKNGIRQGNWLSAEQARSLWKAPDTDRMRGKRDRALLALMLACGLRRHEAVTLRAEDLQQREEHWAIVDLVGKAGHIRTIPMPEWVHVEADPPSRAASFISHAFALGLRTVFRAREVLLPFGNPGAIRVRQFFPPANTSSALGIKY